jgi:hypothetical protein
MGATYNNYGENRQSSHGGNFLLFLGFLVALGMITLTLWATMGPQIGGGFSAVRYGELPFSKHALTAHANQKWNALSIAEYFDSGGCIPKEYTCAAQDFKVAYCELNDNKSIGLIIGATVKQVITGFLANTTFWANRCSQ